MKLTNRLALAAFIVALSAMTFLGQTAIPIPGQNPAAGGQGERGGGQGQRGGGRGGQRGAEAPAEPVKQVVAPIATAVEVTGPGGFFETFMDSHDDVKSIQFPAKDVYAKYNYE